MIVVRVRTCGRSLVGDSAFLFETSPIGVALVLNLRRTSHMVFVGIYRSRITRFIATLIIALVVSPYSEPFATIDGTDFSGAGAVDFVSGSKLKISTQDVLVAVPQVAVFLLDASATVASSLPFSALIDARRSQRAILRV